MKLRLGLVDPATRLALAEVARRAHAAGMSLSSIADVTGYSRQWITQLLGNGERSP